MVEAVTIGTCTGNPFCDITRRRVFYDGTRYWVFYRSNTLFGYKNSTDGKTWSAFTTVWDTFNPYGLAIYYAPPDTVYAIQRSTGNVIQIRKGTIVGGSITWGSVYDVLGESTSRPSLCVDQGGYIWVVGGRYSAPEGVATRRSTNPNDVSLWQTEELWSTDNRQMQMILPLASNRVIVIGSDEATQTAQSRYFNGTSWESPVNIATFAVGWAKWTAIITDDGVVHFVYLTTGGVSLAYRSMASPYTAWSSEIVIDTYPNCRDPQLSKKGNDLYLFYIKGSDIYLARKPSGQPWGEGEAWITAETSPALGSSSLEMRDSIIGVAWRSGTASSPYEVRYASYTPPAPPPEEVAPPTLAELLLKPEVWGVIAMVVAIVIVLIVMVTRR